MLIYEIIIFKKKHKNKVTKKSYQIFWLDIFHFDKMFVQFFCLYAYNKYASSATVHLEIHN